MDGFHGMRLTKEAEEPLEDQKPATKTPSTKVEQQRSIEIDGFLPNFGPTSCSRSTVLNGFDEGTARANDRGIRCEGGSQCSFAPQGGEISSKMECMAGRKCESSHCKTDDFVFSAEIDQTSACGNALTPKEGHLFRLHSSCYYFESPSGRQVLRFDTELQCKRANEYQPKLPSSVLYVQQCGLRTIGFP